MITNERCPTRETGFHSRTSELSTDLVVYKDCWLANSYDGIGAIAEHKACRESVIVTDLSPLRKFEIAGPDAEALLQWTTTRNVRKLAVGQVVYTAMCLDTGGMLDEGTLARLGQDNFRWVGGSEQSGSWLRKQAEERGLRAWVRSSTEQLCTLSVQGPKSRDVLKDVIWTPPAQPTLLELGRFRLAIARIHDYHGIAIVTTRTGYTGELGYEVWCHRKNAVEVWDTVWKAGEPHGITPLGLEALDMLRIESGVVASGAEYSDRTDPFEAGIGFIVQLRSKDEDFVGREALTSRKQNPQSKLVGLELDGHRAASGGDQVSVGNAEAGTITSGVFSPFLQKNIALCRMAVHHAEPGTQVEVGPAHGHEKQVAATVVPLPFYEPEKKRRRKLGLSAACTLEGGGRGICTMSPPIASQWYDVEPMPNGIVWIDEFNIHPGAVGNIWLVTGSERCLLFDTGTGLGNLAKLVAELTDRPVIALVSTGYYDHAGGLSQFGQRAVHRLEAQRVRRPTPQNTVSGKYLTDAALKAIPYNGFAANDYVMAAAEPTELLEDGSTIDLGNRRLDVLHTPGVTQGSIALYEEKSGALFTGESMSDSEEFYIGEPAEESNDADAQARQSSMQRLLDLEVSTVYPGHHSSFDARRMRQILEQYLWG